ncbi:MAG TPA: hypothetical protein DCS07_16240 [Bdellovibrionales bacterium]|nr:MAG: hypothetical protein A2Z97_11415 [Bdellovibrionales bacterium GWB1_52_6]OFZ03863.1 MAG: hypothetical protein A2X97_15805 [Bdellovibrionales bacterium GWA1_52_35]OFZ33743.1 MAG: hypothetical protein A2070_00895 [Bdellovibrionales bacterium GWC1_52_8]HAR44154.1 hypothetical protein [Bdellovibrionales bacterium]HCM39702.1 hypothetical protein [Bdellovibrionales bacterium]
MNLFRIKAFFGLLFIVASALPLSFQNAYAFGFCAGCCGTTCMAQMNNYCPTCNAWNYQPQMTTPWSTPTPYWWQSGPMNYSNFYAPAPWQYYSPQMYSPMMTPGIMGNYYPGHANVGAGKPNIYIEGAAGTDFKMKIRFLEEDANWLAAIPVHGVDGWKGTLGEKNQIKTEQGTYPYFFSDYRVHDRAMQDKEGFCATKDKVIGKMAMSLKAAGFSKMEIGDFLEYWTVKLPQSKSYCVYPQDERQLDRITALDVTPKPKSIRRLLFVVQVEEGLFKNGEKFTSAPPNTWSPQPVRNLASSPAEKGGITVREWGVAFLIAKP